MYLFDWEKSVYSITFTYEHLKKTNPHGSVVKRVQHTLYSTSRRSRTIANKTHKIRFVRFLLSAHCLSCSSDAESAVRVS